MDVTRVLGLVRPFFEKRGEPFAVVRGIALLAYGAPRATFDVDLVARRGVRDGFVAFMEALHFATLSVKPGFSNHPHPEPALGRLDVIYVSGTTADLQFLLSMPGLDQVQVRRYFESAGLADYYEQLRRR